MRKESRPSLGSSNNLLDFIEDKGRDIGASLGLIGDNVPIVRLMDEDCISERNEPIDKLIDMGAIEDMQFDENFGANYYDDVRSEANDVSNNRK